MNSIGKLCVVSTLLFAPLTARAGIIISVDVNSEEDGIQQSVDVAANTAFDVAVFIELTEDTQITSYTLSTRFDSTRFEFLSGSDPNPDGFTDGDDTVIFDALPSSPQFSEVDSLDAFTFDAGRQAGDGGTNPFQIATLRFRAIAPESAGSTTDIATGLFAEDNPQNAFSDGAFEFITSGIQVRGSTINITAVPEPTGVLPISVLSLTLVSRRYRRQRTA
jgi:hypothetical protein